MTAGTSYPKVLRCAFCGFHILRDNDGVWIHASLSYVCRDRWGTLLATTAQPSA